MRNILLTIAYSGINYHGWQIQKNAVTVQEVFQNCLHKILKENLNLKGCSRTDSGVHANMYCISVKIEHKIRCENLLMALNNFLPDDICVLSCEEVSNDFHARYSCKSKEYVYKIWNSRIKNPFLKGYAYHYYYPIDEKLLNEAASYFLGSHDFTSFCTLDQRERKSMIRTVTKSVVKRDGDMIEFFVKADGFLYNMVRIMVGTLLRVSQGKFKVEDIETIINKKNRKYAGPTAQACGLYLNGVFY